MQYTIASRGQPIGTTDLGFFRIGAGSRSGWFHPNDLGERLMPLVASSSPAMRAYICRNTVDEDGKPIVHPEMYGSTMFADLAESMQQAESLQLTLHREDGSLIPTTEVGIADVRELVELSNPTLRELRLEEDEEDEDPEIQAAVEHDIAIIREWFGDSAPWTPEPEEPEEPEAPDFPPYQVHVMLVHPNDVP